LELLLLINPTFVVYARCLVYLVLHFRSIHGDIYVAQSIYVLALEVDMYNDFAKFCCLSLVLLVCTIQHSDHVLYLVMGSQSRKRRALHDEVVELFLGVFLLG